MSDEPEIEPFVLDSDYWPHLYFSAGPSTALPYNPAQPKQVELITEHYNLGMGNLYGFDLEYGFNNAGFQFTDFYSHYQAAFAGGMQSLHLVWKTWSQKVIGSQYTSCQVRAKPRQDNQQPYWTETVSFSFPVYTPPAIEYPPEGPYQVTVVKTSPENSSYPYQTFFGLEYWLPSPAQDLLGFHVEWNFDGSPVGGYVFLNDFRAAYPPLAGTQQYLSMSFNQWSETWRQAPITLVRFRSRPEYRYSVAPYTPYASFVPPVRTPTLQNLGLGKWPDPNYPFLIATRVRNELPCDTLHYSWGFDGGPEVGSMAFGLVANGIPAQHAAHLVDFSFANWSSAWTQNNVKTLNLRVRTGFQSDPVSPYSNVINVPLPGIYPVWQQGSGVFEQVHVRDVIVGGTVTNDGRPLQIGGTPTQGSQTPEKTEQYALVVSGSQAPNIQQLRWNYGTNVPDGAWGRYLTVMARNLVGAVLTDQWTWDANTFAHIMGTIVTAPVLQSIYLEPTIDRLGARVGMVWRMTCAGRGVEVEWQSGQMEEWQPLRTFGGDTIGGLDSYAKDALFSVEQENIDQAAGEYFYRARSFYRVDASTVTYGSWSDVATLAVDISFGMTASTYDVVLMGYSAAQLSAYWNNVDLSYGEVERITVWARTAESDPWGTMLIGAPDPTAYSDRFEATQLAPISFSRNAAWTFTITDGARPPGADDLYQTIVFDDAVELVVEAAELENEDEFA